MKNNYRLDTTIFETTTATPPKPDEQSLKHILFWTHYFSWKGFEFNGMGQKPFIDAKCRYTNCVLTSDRSLLNRSDVVIFHAHDFRDEDVPQERSPEQRYVFFYFEALPAYRRFPIFNSTRKNYFNWTMTHRRDSDIHCNQPYGIIKRKAYFQTPNVLPEPLSPGESPPDPKVLLLDIRTNNSVFISTFANKTKLAVWFRSNCATHGKRETFFEQLGKYITIDTYGGCGTLKCLPSNSPGCDKILDNYKFYISAENSLCSDYVTEKFYRALEAGAIPVVYGGANYSQYAPPHSFVNVADFDSFKDLADYLLLLDRNPRLYAQYFDWKNEWEVDRKPTKGWCDLCEKINNPSEPTKVYEDISQWWFDKIPCVPGNSFMASFKA